MVKSTIKNTNKAIVSFARSGGQNNFLVKTQNTILSAAFVLALSSGVNAVLGLVKSRFLTKSFGVSDELSVFYTADRIPNLIYSVLVVGALSTIFIPIFSSLYKKNKEDAWKAASSIINISLLVFIILGSVIFIFAYQIIQLLSINRFTAEQIELGAGLMRVMMFGQLILIVSSFLTSLLQSFKYFIIPALAPVVYNFGMLFGIIFLSERFGIYGPALGVLIGAALHLLIQIPLMRKTNFKFFLALNIKDKGTRELFRLIPPRLLSVLIANTLYTVNNSLAILISNPSVVFLKFGTQLQYFPVNFIGISMASAALPTLSQESDETDRAKFKKTFLTSFHQMMFMVIPISVIFLVLRIPVVRLVYGVEQFPWEATLQTAATLGFFSISIFAQSAIYLITRAFYALKDTLTPVKVSLVTIFLNVFLSLVFIKGFGWEVWSVALSFSITSIIDMVLMFILLAKKMGGFGWKPVLIPFTKIAFSGIFMGISLYLPIKALDQVVFDTTRTLNLLVLTGIATFAGLLSYLFFTKIFRVEEIQLLYKLLGKLRIRELKKSDSTYVAEEKPEI